MGRLLITLLLIERKLLLSPLLYLSAFFEATRNEYYDLLFSISSKGLWQEWLLYFLNGVAIQGLDVLSRAERMNALIVEWQIKVGHRSDGITLKIVNNLAVNPFCTVKMISEKLRIAFTTAQRAIRKLEELKILTQTSERKRDKVYCAKEILDILEESTKIRENMNGQLEPL